MVHSGSASPMKTTPSASPLLTVPALTPPLVPPPGNTTDQDPTQTPADLLTNNLTSNSVFTQPSTPSPADAQPAVVTPAKALAADSRRASAWSSTQTPSPSQVPVNGRTSGRKRTPKACDCCGPNSTGHNVRSSGRGRGRGRGRGTVRVLKDTPKRNVGSQLTHIKSHDLTKEVVEEAKGEDETYKKVQTAVIMADTQSQSCAVADTSLEDGPVRNCVAQDEGDTETNEDLLTTASGVAGTLEKGGADSSDTEMRLRLASSRPLGGRGRGRGRGRGLCQTIRGASASKMKIEGEIKREDSSSSSVCSKMDQSAQSVVAQRQEENKDAEREHEEQTDYSMVKSPFGNGETVSLFDTKSEGVVKLDSTVLSEPANELLTISQQSNPTSRSGSPQDLDFEMHEDQIPDKTDQVSLLLTLSNGSNTTTTEHNHRCTPMEVEACHSPVASPLEHGPITVCNMQHHWALKDHMLYCRPGTWEKEGMEEMQGKDQSEKTEMDGMMQNKEHLEQLTDMVHEFLENFYIKYGSFIALSETDVLEYLKNKGNSDLSNRGLDIKSEMTRYRAGLASAPFAGFMVMYNKHTLSLEDLGTLEEQNWLNDQIINMYGELIMEATQHKVHFFNSFFHKKLVAKGYDGVKRWTKKVDLFSKWLLLIPIHLEIHWSLVTVTMATKTISYYDSQGIVFRHTTDNIMKYLQSEAREKKQAAFQKGWKITIIKGIPQQKNDSDCGVFVLEYCRCLSVKQPLLFSQEDMPHIRKRIYKELCDCRLND